MISLLLILFIPGGLTFYDISNNFHWVPCINPAMKFKKSLSHKFIVEPYTILTTVQSDTVSLFFKFDSEAKLKLGIQKQNGTGKYIIRELPRPKNSHYITFSGNFKTFLLNISVSGTASKLPYLKSALRDYQDICEYSREDGRYNSLRYEIKPCGRQKVVHTELIVHGQSTEPGDWPWHVAILRIEKTSHQYICGGTLLSKTLVLTAAHCASISGSAVTPEILVVHLGKHNLIGGNKGAQEREVSQVILHPEFDGVTLDNDIALLQLKSEVVFNDYVQPACLWHENYIHRLPDRESIFGTVVGWGFNHEDTVSSTLQKITIPIVSECTCLKSNPAFFHKRLNYKNFCAGFANGTSVCNGDSGGGLMIAVPDSPDDNNTSHGWHVRGIVSTSSRRFDTNTCDPNEYTIFTDVEKYLNWLMDNIILYE